MSSESESSPFKPKRHMSRDFCEDCRARAFSAAFASFFLSRVMSEVASSLTLASIFSKSALHDSASAPSPWNFVISPKMHLQMQSSFEVACMKKQKDRHNETRNPRMPAQRANGLVLRDDREFGHPRNSAEARDTRQRDIRRSVDYSNSHTVMTGPCTVLS